MTRYAEVREELRRGPRRWLVTGAAGFIGSHLVEALLALGQDVVGLDSFATGSRRNLDEALHARAGGRFRSVEGDVRDLAACREACRGMDYVLHHAAACSAPHSVEDPLGTTAVNVGGTLNVLAAAREAGVRRVVYASSSAVYGDARDLPAREPETGAALSPYALTKQVGEQYAALFARLYGTRSTGLRYFNVFGPRQDASGAYAAVIPEWGRAMLAGRPCTIHGDGGTTRDFTWVGDAVQASLLAATAAHDDPAPVYNVGSGRRTSLLELHAAMAAALRSLRPDAGVPAPVHASSREGDVRHSQADVTRIATELGYRPTADFAACLRTTLQWLAARTASSAPVGATGDAA